MFDNLVISLCKFTTLLTTPEVPYVCALSGYFCALFVDCLVMFVDYVVMFLDMFVMYFILITAPQIYGLHYWDQPQSSSQHTHSIFTGSSPWQHPEGRLEEHAGLFDCIVQSKAST